MVCQLIDWELKFWSVLKDGIYSWSRFSHQLPYHIYIHDYVIKLCQFFPDAGPEINLSTNSSKYRPRKPLLYHPSEWCHLVPI